MDAKELEQVMERLARLESSNRRLGRAVVVLLVVLASAVWMGQRSTTKAPQRKAPAPPVAKVVEAEQFVMKTAAGRVLATLAATDGGPALHLIGPSGTDRAVVGVDALGTPRLVMTRADGSQALAVALAADGVPRVEVTSPDNLKARLTIGAEGPEIGIVDGAGTTRLALNLKPEGPAISLVDADKVTRASLNTVERGPNFVLFDATGRSRMMLSVRQDQAALGMQDSKGEVRAGLEVRSDNPAFALYGPNGKPLFVKP